MYKKTISCIIALTCFTSTSFAQIDNKKQEQYDNYIEEHYKKITMFNLIDKLNKKHNKNIVYLEPIELQVSYYTDLNCENGFGSINCKGKRLQDGMIANNIMELGTQIYIPELGLKTVEDRGSKKYFDRIDAIDVFIPRQFGETDRQYYKRVNNLGIHKATGYIITEK